MKKRNTQQLATKADVEMVKIDVKGVKADVEALAVSTAKEFTEVHRKFTEVHHKIDTLNEKVDTGFADMRQEMQEGFRMVLAAVETVEYTKLRMRIDSLETDVARIKEKVRVS